METHMKEKKDCRSEKRPRLGERRKEGKREQTLRQTLKETKRVGETDVSKNGNRPTQSRLKKR